MTQEQALTLRHKNLFLSNNEGKIMRDLFDRLEGDRIFSVNGKSFSIKDCELIPLEEKHLEAWGFEKNGIDVSGGQAHTIYLLNEKKYRFTVFVFLDGSKHPQLSFKDMEYTKVFSYYHEVQNYFNDKGIKLESKGWI